MRVYAVQQLTPSIGALSSQEVKFFWEKRQVVRNFLFV